VIPTATRILILRPLLSLTPKLCSARVSSNMRSTVPSTIRGAVLEVLPYQALKLCTTGLVSLDILVLWLRGVVIYTMMEVRMVSADTRNASRSPALKPCSAKSTLSRINGFCCGNLLWKSFA